jgi:hypothetical protein
MDSPNITITALQEDGKGAKKLSTVSPQLLPVMHHDIHKIASKVVDKPVARAASSCYTFGNTSS